jgi:uncharacterized membrane protein
MEQYWLGFFAGLLFFVSILNLITLIEYKRKNKQLSNLIQKIKEQTEKDESEPYDYFEQWDR